MDRTFWSGLGAEAPGTCSAVYRYSISVNALTLKPSANGSPLAPALMPCSALAGMKRAVPAAITNSFPVDGRDPFSGKPEVELRGIVAVQAEPSAWFHLGDAKHQSV